MVLKKKSKELGKLRIVKGTNVIVFQRGKKIRRVGLLSPKSMAIIRFLRKEKRR